ncbi:hypothetical protein PG990_013610 [Apiospora arundinis]
MNDGIKLDSRDDENAALRLQVHDLTQRLEKVREQLEEERDDHVMELAGLHRMYQAKFKKLVKILKASTPPATTMAPPHITGNGHGSTNNTAVDVNHVCATCHKGFSSRRNLFHEQLKVHQMKKHGVNPSVHVCYMQGCTRKAGVGFFNEIWLWRHLMSSHQGATLKDNEKAKADRASQKATQDHPVQQPNTSTDIMDDNPTSSEERDDGSSDSDVDSDKPTDGGALSATSLWYEQRIAHLEEQIAEERDGHLMEVEDLHKMYKAKRQKDKMVIKELLALIARQE